MQAAEALVHGREAVLQGKFKDVGMSASSDPASAASVLRGGYLHRVGVRGAPR